MLIRGAEVWSFGLADVRIDGACIAEVGRLAPRAREPVIEARGGALLPGLHDHHIHLAGLAARQASLWCGPPAIADAAQLAAALAAPGEGWLRGIGYHESVMGLPDAAALDRLCPDRPLRIQHRSGRMWLLNSRALDHLLERAEPPPGLEREGGRFTGRLFDEDAWLRTALASAPPAFAAVSAELARHGVTGLTDMTPQNDPAMAAHFARERAGGALRQAPVLAGTLDLAMAPAGGWRLGPAKLHLHEAALPDFAAAERLVRSAHAQGRGVAVHCTTEVELVFTLALLEAAGSIPGDRIEHAGVALPDHVARMAALGVPVCVQPHFIAERGDRYLADVEPQHRPHLYRLASLRDAGIALAGGSDAPFADTDPWRAMRAAVSRTTDGGHAIGPAEALSADEAIQLYLADPLALDQQRRIAAGEAADLCLLDHPWTVARERLVSGDVRLAIAGGQIIHQRIDEPPFARAPGG